jgi:LPXTG-site transpeptidase (sortase) family protein
VFNLYLHLPYRDKKSGLLVLYNQQVTLNQKRLNLFSRSLILLSFSGLIVNSILLHLPVYSEFSQNENPKNVDIQEKSENIQQWLEDNNFPPETNTNFSLLIPKINLNTKIIPNVSLTSEKEIREKLKEGIGHAKGSSFPGELGTAYIFGHSSVYPWETINKNHLLSELNNLEKEDKIFIIYKDTVYHYSVTDKDITSAKDTSYLNHRGDEEKLILQTCWPPETNWKRLLVFARPVK